MGYHRDYLVTVLPCYQIPLFPFPTLLQTERGHAVWHALWGNGEQKEPRIIGT